MPFEKRGIIDNLFRIVWGRSTRFFSVIVP